LLDGDRRPYVLCAIDKWALNFVEKLSDVRGERLDVTALTFCVDGIESERGLAGTGEARNHYKLIMRKLKREILKIILSSAGDF
jgi:hypothetical protein